MKGSLFKQFFLRGSSVALRMSPDPEVRDVFTKRKRARERRDLLLRYMPADTLLSFKDGHLVPTAATLVLLDDVEKNIAQMLGRTDETVAYVEQMKRAIHNMAAVPHPFGLLDGLPRAVERMESAGLNAEADLILSSYTDVLVRYWDEQGTEIAKHGPLLQELRDRWAIQSSATDDDIPVEVEVRMFMPEVAPTFADGSPVPATECLTILVTASRVLAHSGVVYDKPMRRTLNGLIVLVRDMGHDASPPRDAYTRFTEVLQWFMERRDYESSENLLWAWKNVFIRYWREKGTLGMLDLAE